MTAHAHPVREPACNVVPRGAWTIDRCGRLLAGSFVVACMALAWLGWVPAWIAGVAVAGAGLQLVLTSLLGWCPLQQMLRRLGFKEREEVAFEVLHSRSAL